MRTRLRFKMDVKQPPTAALRTDASTSSAPAVRARPRRVTHTGMTGPLAVGLDIRPSSHLLARAFSSQSLAAVSKESALPSIARPSPALMLDVPAVSQMRPHADATPRPRQTRSRSIASLERVARGSDIRRSVSPASTPPPSPPSEASVLTSWDRLLGFASSSSAKKDIPEADEDGLDPRPPSKPPPSRWATLFGGKAAAADHAEQHSDPPSVFISRMWSSAFSPAPVSSEDAAAAGAQDGHQIVEEHGRYTDDRLRDFQKPNHPLVLVHGLLGWGVIGPKDYPSLTVSYWKGVREALEEVGVEVLIATVPTTASIEVHLPSRVRDSEAHKICRRGRGRFRPSSRSVCRAGPSIWSDTRWAVSTVASSSASFSRRHSRSPRSRCGSSLVPCSDMLMSARRHWPRRIEAARLPTISSTTSSHVRLFPCTWSPRTDDATGKHLPKLRNLTTALSIPGGGAAYEQLTVDNMSRFNKTTPDVDGVAYFSYGAAFEPGYTNIFRLPWGVIWEKEGPNDGLVSVESSKWGDYQRTLDNVNHLDLIGWIGPCVTLCPHHKKVGAAR